MSQRHVLWISLRDLEWHVMPRAGSKNAPFRGRQSARYVFTPLDGLDLLLRMAIVCGAAFGLEVSMGNNRVIVVHGRTSLKRT